ncbi:UPF0182 family protein [Halochromatium salexigens]|uniref:UPF0182 protein CCR82_05955 n=1 Tax=Halochromatium salexigens TaxID=49447 RepID=A0AAJ0UEP8_HALSE|nr:UPF0182 family protein [Halochromatium salexigens]MBK5930079.1 hypothetical protein [Halochromatium salexigens]
MTKKRLGRRIRLFVLVLLPLMLAIALPIFALVYAGGVVEIWWYQSLGLGFYFWQRLLYSYVVFAVLTTFFFFFFYLNFRLAARYMRIKPLAPKKVLLRFRRKAKQAKPRHALSLGASTERPRGSARLLHWLILGLHHLSLLVALVLAVVLAAPLYRRWEETLLFLFAPRAGLVDPVYGHDISYYLFALPLFRTMLFEVFFAFGVLLTILGIIYYLQFQALKKRGLNIAAGAKRHLSVIIALMFCVGIVEWMFQRHALLYTDSHTPLFFGAGYTEMNIVLPLIWSAMIMLVILGASLIWSLNTRRGLSLVVVSATLLAITVGLRYWDAIPAMVQDYMVEPDELARQEPYIRDNITATLDAFGLAEVETRPYRVPATASADRAPEDLDAAGLRNIPVWDRDMLIDVYREMQEIRSYYRFLSVNTDRYTIDGRYQQVFLAARELDFDRLPKDSQNWVNRWFRYTHGYGAVMSPAAQFGEEAKEWYLKDMPPRSEYGLTIEEPGIYYGMQDLYDVIAPNALGEISYPGQTGVVQDDYRANTGIPIDGWFRRAIFALYYRDYKLFFTTAIQPDSQILIRRNVPSTIRVVTPFLELDSDPYLVVTPGHLYWIIDAYTLSDRYPYAEPVNRNVGKHPDHWMASPIAKEFNYIRNSVKIVVDAYTGEMDYYLADPDDPIARAYQRMYPGLLKDMEQFPDALRAHIRYPQDLFSTQMSVYAKYHQTDPAVFYGQEDRWMFPQISRRGDTKTLLPYYVTLNLIDRSQFEHLLLAPMNPKGRDNMRAFAVVSSDAPNYGRIIVYSLPTGMLVLGLSQIDALIEQDSKIAEQFTLWGRGGAEIKRGKLILILIDDVITYVQPVYLQAAHGVKIPQLKRVIVSQGGKVAMAPSLEEAVAALREGQRQRAEKARKRTVTAPPPQPASSEPASTTPERLSGGRRPNASSASGPTPD